MWQSRIHKVREFESSRSYNKSLLKSSSLKKHNKHARASDSLFIRMSHARYSPLDYGQNRDKDRIHNHGKQILHFALKIPSYLFICFIAVMGILVPLLWAFVHICFLAVKRSPDRSKARNYYYKTKSISHYRSDF